MPSETEGMEGISKSEIESKFSETKSIEDLREYLLSDPDGIVEGTEYTKADLNKSLDILDFSYKPALQEKYPDLVKEMQEVGVGIPLHLRKDFEESGTIEKAEEKQTEDLEELDSLKSERLIYQHRTDKIAKLKEDTERRESFLELTPEELEILQKRKDVQTRFYQALDEISKIEKMDYKARLNTIPEEHGFRDLVDGFLKEESDENMHELNVLLNGNPNLPEDQQEENRVNTWEEFTEVMSNVDNIYVEGTDEDGIGYKYSISGPAIAALYAEYTFLNGHATVGDNLKNIIDMVKSNNRLGIGVAIERLMASSFNQEVEKIVGQVADGDMDEKEAEEKIDTLFKDEDQFGYPKGKDSALMLIKLAEGDHYVAEKPDEPGRKKFWE